ncbi:hypothetical protein C5C66_03410 [Rathayibacter toxicus]|uniref:ABC transporter domain-containing protein n=2 Tax=Rathayibacter toxicus TaxID=145458 RepID=A0A0C5BE49_9MICO|nr:hypothetical protein TI83_03585 [Rathayibacter toxicus]ALS56842.1 hypothetical protein APU90_02885 [Rathayibacter toxicus]KKM46315.1 hypothetical protein VT73_04605 [Rathayibacter toxicus]PPG23292.1 hypothetical protein C5D15_03385 [Rathayibacter toxicus]PPG47874.1 hypothetical protein C5D16_03375 [Rathayibacter toxicus]
MRAIVAEGAGCFIDDQALLAPVDIELDYGERVAVRGVNGAGKTTLLRMLSGNSCDWSVRRSSWSATIPGLSTRSPIGSVCWARRRWRRVVSDTDSLRLARSIISSRAGRPSRGDTVYGIYVAVCVAGVVVFPIVRAAMIGLAVPGVVVVVSESMTTGRISVALAVISGLVFLLGRLRGPVVPSEPYIETAVASPLPRSLTLRRSFTTGRILLVVVLALVAMTLLGGEAMAVPVDPLGALVFLGGVVCLTWLLSLVWLAGQWSGRHRRVFAVALTVAIVLQVGIALLPATALLAAWFSPWGWTASLWSALQGLTSAHSVGTISRRSRHDGTPFSRSRRPETSNPPPTDSRHHPGSDGAGGGRNRPR